MNENTTAASGAAPLTDAERAELDQLRLLAGGQSCIPKVIEALGPMSLWSAAALKDHIDREVAAALASPQVAPALTDERIRDLWIEQGLDECDPEGFARVIEREVRALATPVQVAPPKLTHEQINDEVRRIRRTDDSWESLPEIRLAQWAYARGIEAAFAAAPVAPQDDARDAASNDLPKKLMAIARRDGLTWEDRVAIGRAIAALSPAAKPTEPTPGAGHE